MDDQLKGLHKELCGLLTQQVDQDMSEIGQFMRSGQSVMNGSLSSVEDIDTTRQACSQMVFDINNLNGFCPCVALCRNDTYYD